MNRKFFTIAAMMLLMPMMMGAQALKGSYFLDNSLNRHQLNPAFAPKTGYFQIPVVGNFGTSIVSNIGLNTYLYPVGGQLYTFLNKNVTVEQLEATLPNKPYMDEILDLNLLNFGWKAGKGFWSVDMGVEMEGSIDTPRDLFMFMKKGSTSSGSYNIGNVKLNASLAAQAALGYSRDLSDLVPGLRVGAKVRAILPLAYFGVDFQQMNLTTSPEKWTLSTKAVANGAIADYEIEVGPVGFGFSADLGAEYMLEFDGFINGVSFSASVTDLGSIIYSAETARQYAAGGDMDWTGMSLSLEEGAVDTAMEELKSEVGKLFEFKEVTGSSSFSRSTNPGFYLGAEMPFLNNKMSIGALYSARKSFNYMRNELTLSYNLTPANWFALGVNYSFLNSAKNLGCVLELTPKVGTAFYFGVDYWPLEWAMAPDILVENIGITKLPLSSCMSFRLGFAIAFGGKEKVKAEE